MYCEENRQRRHIGAGLVLALALIYPGVSIVGSESGFGLDQSAYAGGKGGGGGNGGGGASRGGGSPSAGGGARAGGAPVGPRAGGGGGGGASRGSARAPAPAPRSAPVQSPRQDTQRQGPVVSQQPITQGRQIDRILIDRNYRQAAQASRDTRPRGDVARPPDQYFGRDIDRRVAEQATRGADREKPQPRPGDSSGRGADGSSGRPQRGPDAGTRGRTPGGDKPGADPIVKPIPMDDGRPGRPDTGNRMRDPAKPADNGGKPADRANRGSSRDPVTVWSGRDGRRSSFSDPVAIDKPRPGSSTLVDQLTIRNRVHRNSVAHSSGFHHNSHSWNGSCFSSRPFCSSSHFCNSFAFSFSSCYPFYPYYGGCWYPYRSGLCNDSFGFYYSGSCFSLGFSFSNWNSCYYPWYGPVYYSHYYDDCRPAYSCWSDCGWYRRPVYGCYRPYYYPAYSYDSYYSGAAPYYGDSYSSGYDSGIASTYPPEPSIFATSSDGWDLLIDGDAREARRAFDRAIGIHPNDALSQIGYSISAALLGRYDEAVASMRRAMRDDPESLKEVPENDKLDASMRQLLEHYAAIVKQSPGDVDALFMTAALRFLVDDAAMAYFAVDQGISQGDHDASAQNLKRLIQTSLQKNPGPSTEPSNAPAPLSLPAPVSAPSIVTQVSY